MNLKKMSAVFLAVLALAVVVAACSSDSKSSGPAPATFTTTAQASTSSAAAANTATTGLNVTSSVTSLSSVGTGLAGYSPRLAAIRANHAAKLQAKENPTLSPQQKAVQKKFKSIMAAPTLKRAIGAARSQSILRTTVSDSMSCPNGGSITVTGTDNSDVTNRTNDTYSVTIAFNSCRDTDGSSYWMQFNGSITDAFSAPVNMGNGQPDVSGSFSSTSTFSSFGVNEYNGGFTGSPVMTSTISGAFGETFSFTVQNNGASGTASGTTSANGSFTGTIVDPGYGTLSFTTAFGSLTDSAAVAWNDSTGRETWTDTLGGSYSDSFALNNQTLLSFTLTFSALQQKFEDFYSVGAGGSLNYTGEENMWLNGGIAMVWGGQYASSIIDTDCMGGSFTFVTADATPIHTPAGGGCPNSGTLKINTATITFTSTGGVTLAIPGQTTQTWTSCTLFDAEGDVCSQSLM